MFSKVLIANRGEIALRIVRTCKEMGIKTVAVHSTADERAMHVRFADESVCIGGASATESYLNIPAILSAAHITGCDALHPGIGFLSENAEFSELVREMGITFIGPSTEHMRVMGNKVTAKQTAQELGLPVVPGSDGPVETLKEAQTHAKKIGYPVLLKAAMGGGGRGMRVVESADALSEAMDMTQMEAEASFGNRSVYLEKYLHNPRHIEIQVLGDGHGSVVHLGERDCSLQRRHQKLLEEGPSPALTPEQRQDLGQLTAECLKKINYLGAGTVEYLYANGYFYFIEMNTRLQVEHPVTEMITGIDLVREQIHIAAGKPLSFTQTDVHIRGHAIECRINAEHPETFMPSPGTITHYHPAGGSFVRVDSPIYGGYTVPSSYDSLVAKLIVWGSDRDACIRRLRRAAEEFLIEGIDTTLPLHRRLMDDDDFCEGDYHVNWLADFVAKNKS